MLRTNPFIEQSFKAFGLGGNNKNNISDEKIDMGIGEPLPSLFPMDELQGIWDIPRIGSYYPPLGDEKLKEMIIGRYYAGYESSNMVITNGGIGALDIIVRSHLSANDTILIPDPGFPPYEQLALLNGVNAKKYNIHLKGNDTLLDWDSVNQQLSEKTKLLLVNTPHNPTGKILTSKDERQLRQILEFYPNLIIVIDEVYRDILFADETHYNLSDLKERVIKVGSFSKMYPIQGARIGWLVASKVSIELIKPYAYNTLGAVSSFGQEVAKNLLSKSLSFKGVYENNAAIAINLLRERKADYICPKGAFYLYINTHQDSKAACLQLKEDGVIALPGSLFSNEISTYIRVSLANTPDKISRGIELICQFLEKKVPATVMCSNYIASFLNTRKTSQVFGVSGANIEDLLVSIEAENIKVILAKNEYNAGLMAIGSYLKTNKIQMVYTTSGGGFLNIIPILAEAHASRMPMVVISGQVPQSLEGKGGFQDASGKADTFDITEVVKPITAFCKYITNVNDVPRYLQLAYFKSRQEKRPTVLFIPKNIFLENTVIPPVEIQETVDSTPIEIQKSYNELHKILSPKGFLFDSFFIFGEECLHLKDQTLIQNVIDRLNAPFALTSVSKGLFDNTDARFKGLIGVMGHKEVKEELCSKSNIFLIGCQLNLINTYELTPMLAGKNIIIINEFPTYDLLDLKDATISQLNLPPDVALNIVLQRTDNQPVLPQKKIKKTEEEVGDLFTSKNIILLINKFLKSGDDLFVDAGNTGAFSVHYLRPKDGGIFYISMGMGGMGNSIGAAIGSTLSANHQKRSYVFIGDGSFMMHGMEIQTAIEHNLPITIFIFNDNAHGMCILREQLFQDNISTINKFKPSFFGKGFKHIFSGIESFEISSLKALNKTLELTRDNKKVNLLSLNISRGEIPPFLPLSKIKNK